MNYLDEDKLREWDEFSLYSRIYNEANKPEPIDRILYAAACGIKNAGNEDDCTEEAARQYGYNYSNERPGMVQPARDGFIAGAEWKAEQMMKEAVEADVNTYRDLVAGKSWAEFVVEMPISSLGDKVKLIILGGDKFKPGDRIIYHGNGYEITGVDDKWYKVKADVPSKIPELEINAISKDNEKDIKRQE